MMCQPMMDSVFSNWYLAQMNVGCKLKGTSWSFCSLMCYFNTLLTCVSIIFLERCKMLSHLAFMCAREGRPCPLYAIGCSEIHSSAEVDSADHMELLMAARLSGACNVSSHALPDLETTLLFSLVPRPHTT